MHVESEQCHFCHSCTHVSYGGTKNPDHKREISRVKITKEREKPINAIYVGPTTGAVNWRK